MNDSVRLHTLFALDWSIQLASPELATVVEVPAGKLSA
jgi:hypothetical protein